MTNKEEVERWWYTNKGWYNILHRGKSFEASGDFDTVLDKQGRRWVDSFNIFGDRRTFNRMVKKANLVGTR